MGAPVNTEREIDGHAGTPLVLASIAGRRVSAAATMAAVLLPLAVAMPAPVAAETPAGPPVESSSPPAGESSGPAAPAAVPVRRFARQQAARRRARQAAVDPLPRLAAALKLDAAQQAEVRRALQAQREALRRLANAPADPDVPRVAAIHAIADRTAERIRAVLNDEQKKLYGQPLPHDPAAGEDRRSVEEWMKAMRPKEE